MDGIGHFEYNIAEVYQKIADHVPLTLDDKINYYLDGHRIKLKEAEVETNPEKSKRYLLLAEKYLETVARLEKRLDIKVIE